MDRNEKKWEKIVKTGKKRFTFPPRKVYTEGDAWNATVDFRFFSGEILGEPKIRPVVANGSVPRPVSERVAVSARLRI